VTTLQAGLLKRIAAERKERQREAIFRKALFHENEADPQAGAMGYYMKQEFIPTVFERRLIAAAARGAVADYQSDDELSNKVADGEHWDNTRTIRAELLRSLCTGLNTEWQIHPKGVSLKGAKIVGSLDFTGMMLSYPLTLIDCWLQSPIILTDAQTKTLTFSGCHVPGIVALRVSVQGSFFLDKKFVSSNKIQMVDAKIKGSMVVDNARFENPNGAAFHAPRLNVEGALFFLNGFHAEGEINLIDANIGGTLAFVDSTLKNPSRKALDAERIIVKGGIYLRKNFNSSGEIKLLGAQAGGILQCEQAILDNPGGIALNANGMLIKGAVVLRNAFIARGAVKFSFANIGATLEAVSATFENPGQTCLEASEMTTGGSVNLGKVFKAYGLVELTGAKIGGGLSCESAEFNSLAKVTLAANRIIVKHNMELKNFKAQGEIQLLGAEIGGSLHCEDVHLKNTAGVTLLADRIDIKGSAFLDKRFLSEGQVRMGGAHIGGELNCSQATFIVSPRAFRAPGMEVKGTFFWRKMSIPPLGIVNLNGAKVGRLSDDPGSWPSSINIDNFIYDSFDRPTLTIKQRLSWLRRQETFSNQPYEQAINVLRRMGQEKEAREMARAKQDDLRKWGDLNRYGRAWNRFLGLTIGHGYQIWRVLLFSLFFTVLGAAIFESAFQSQVMVPIKDRPTNYVAGPRCPSNIPCFEPVIYSVDVFLPIVDLRQESYWLPVANGPYSLAFSIYYWIHILLGWVLTTLGVAGLAGLVKKD
jgi:hypothetical protein